MMTQVKRIQGEILSCPCCGSSLLFTDEDGELVALNLPEDEPSQVNEASGTSNWRSGIRVEEAVEGWNKYIDPTHVKKQPLLQTTQGIPVMETARTQEVTKPEIVDDEEVAQMTAGSMSDELQEMLTQDLWQRGLTPEIAETGKLESRPRSSRRNPQHQPPTKAAMSPRFRSKLERARRRWGPDFVPTSKEELL
jgi:hypothetical protein